MRSTIQRVGEDRAELVSGPNPSEGVNRRNVPQRGVHCRRPGHRSASLGTNLCRVGPQPHPSFIEVFGQTAFRGREREVERAGKDRPSGLNRGAGGHDRLYRARQGVKDWQAQIR